MRKVGLAVALLALVLEAPVAHAYIGPGAGAGTIAIVLGILSSIFLAFVGILWYPVKRLLKGKKAKAAGTSAQGQEGVGASQRGSGNSSLSG